MADDDLDRVLDSALDDFDCIPSTSSRITPGHALSKRMPLEEDPEENLASFVDTQDFGKFVQGKNMYDFQSETKNETSPEFGDRGLGFDPLGSRRNQSTRKKKTEPTKQVGINEVDEDLTAMMTELLKMNGTRGGSEGQNAEMGAENFAATLAALSKHAEENNSGGGDAEDGQDGGEFDFMRGLGGDSPDMHSLVDSMMEHLLSKEVLYPPLKEIAEKYPAWLEQNRPPLLSSEDHQKYQKQFSLIQQLLTEYEVSNPIDYSVVMELLQHMQESGQPPAELIKDMAPGMESGPDGMPQFPTEGLPPELAQQCVIM